MTWDLVVISESTICLFVIQNTTKYKYFPCFYKVNLIENSNQDISKRFLINCLIVSLLKILPEYSVTVDQNSPVEGSLWTQCSPCSSV